MELVKEKKYDPADDNRLDKKSIYKLIKAPNIAAILDDSDLTGIGQDCLRGYHVDKNSLAAWERLNEQALKLATQVAEAKSFPWANAANVKYPLITTSAIQFHARAYPAIIQGNQIAKGVVNGYDPEGQKKGRAERIGKHMSYQLLNEMEEWEEETDKLLLILAITGCCFRKTFYSPLKGRICSIFIPAQDVVVNHGAKSLETAARISHEFELFGNEIEERERSGLFIECDYDRNEDDTPVRFIEQHCWIDIDDDDYKEPYIVTIHKDTGKVVRIVSRFTEKDVDIIEDRVMKITPMHYFTKYSFIPNPDGGFYDIGLGSLLTPLSDTINTVINQILDAGTAQNAGGGFIGSGLRLKSGSMRFSPGEFKPVNQTGGVIRDNIVTLPQQGPSPVLFNMLGMLIEAGKDIPSVKDILTGESRGANESPTTTLALIEQGQKVFTAIYKRIHRSLKQELRKIFNLNRMYLPAESYYMVLDTAEPIGIEDYQDDLTDVTPTSDPNMSTDAQEMARGEAYMKFAGDPYVNQTEIRRRYFKALKEENIDSIMNKEPQPDPAQLQEQLKAMQEQGQQMQQQFGQFQQRAQEENGRLKAENVQLKQIYEQSKITDQIKGELDNLVKREIAVKEKELNAKVSDVIIKSEAEKMASDMSIEVDQAISKIQTMITAHEMNMANMATEKHSEDGAQEIPNEVMAQMRQNHQEFMLVAQGIIESLNQKRTSYIDLVKQNGVTVGAEVISSPV